MKCTIDNKNLGHLSQIIIPLLTEEAVTLLDSFSQSKGIFYEREIKLEIDVALDELFKESLEKQTGIPVFAEESKGYFSLESGQFWIVDPLDGSLNFSRGIPFYSSSIALWRDGEPLLGFVYDYSHRELFSGNVVENQFCINEKKITNKTRPTTFEIKATGIPSGSSWEESQPLFAESFKKYKKLRWLGSASLSLAYVAANRFDAYEERGIRVWDVAAGMALVRAAGGHVHFTARADGGLNVCALSGGEL